VNKVRLAAAACGLLLLAGCGTGSYSDASPELQPLSAPLSSQTTSPTDPPAGQRIVMNGLAISISVPKSFTPTHSAYPRTPRAVAFEMRIDNEGTDPFQPSQLAVTATSNGAPTQQVIDSTQGYTGLVATDEVRPGQSVRLTVAFAVPQQRADLQLMVQPSGVDGGRFTLFTGTV
jgi:hypothetical protein